MRISASTGKIRALFYPLVGGRSRLISRLYGVFGVREIRFSSLAESWAAISIRLLLIGFVALYLTSRDWLKGLSVLVSVFMVFESVFRRRFQTLIVQATLALTVFATLILIYAFFWEIVILSVVGIGLLVIVDNLRELRGSRRR